MACSIPVIRPAGTSPVNFSGVTLFFSVQFGVGQKAEGFWPASLGATKIALDADAIRAVGGSVGAVVTTGLDTPAEVRVGFSLVSTAVARANVAKFAQLSFDEVAEASWRTWDNTLSRISIEDDASAPAAASGRNLFYSVLFHALRKPTDFTEQVFWTWACPPPPPIHVAYVPRLQAAAHARCRDLLSSSCNGVQYFEFQGVSKASTIDLAT